MKRLVFVLSLLFSPLVTTQASAQATFGLGFQPNKNPGGLMWNNGGSADVLPATATAFNVVAYGATGDGTTDDGTAIAAAITAASAATPGGGAVYFPPPTNCYKITAPIAINSALTLFGQKSKICQATANTVGMSITTSNVHVDGLLLSGPAIATYQGAGFALSITGTFHAGSAPTYISNVSVTNSIIQHWGAYGVYAAYVDQFSASRNYINDIGYAGIAVISGTNGRIEGNGIDTIGPGNSGNAYGIALSRDTTDSGELISQPPTTDYAVSGNTIRNVPIWEGLDTHGGERITFSGNTIYNVKDAIGVGASKNSSHNDTYAPHSVTVVGNVADSSVTNGSAGYGIVFQGVVTTTPAVVTDYATGSIVGNYLKGYGDQTNAISGAMYIYSTSGLSVSGNSIVNASPQGINMYHDNVGFVISGNSIIDPWTSIAAVGQAIAVNIAAGANTGGVSGNTFYTNGLSAPYLLTTSTGEGVDIANAAGNVVQVGPNQSVATTYLHDPGNLAVASPFASLSTAKIGTMLASPSFGPALADTTFGFGSTFKVLRLGVGGANHSVALNVDPTSILGSSFSGTSQILIGNNSVLAPNSAGTDWMPVLRATGGLAYIGTASASGELNTTLGVSVDNSGNTVVPGSLTLNKSGYTAGTLPTGIVGMMARVTDGVAGLAWGATITGGGSTNYLVWYNGTNWTVAGK